MLTYSLIRGIRGITPKSSLKETKFFCAWGSQCVGIGAVLDLTPRGDPGRFLLKGGIVMGEEKIAEFIIRNYAMMKTFVVKEEGDKKHIRIFQ